MEPVEPPEAARIALDDLRDQLEALSDRGFDGGLLHDDVAIAEALAEAARESGIPREHCKDPRFEFGSERGPSAIIGNDVLDLLRGFLAKGNHKQRAVALLAVARIGPGIWFDPDFLIEKSVWANDAVSGTHCVGGRVDDLIEFNWPDVPRNSVIGSLPLLELLIDKMLDDQRVYPSGALRYAIEQVLYEENMPPASAERLVPILEDDRYSDEVRGQVIDLFAYRNLPMDVFEPPIAALYDRSPALRERAGHALFSRNSRRAADILANAIEEAPDTWPESWGCRNCELIPESERLVDVLLRASRSDLEEVRALSISALGCSRNERAIPRLTEILETPFWTLQRAAIEALGRMKSVPPPTLAILREIASSHWSALVRRSAADLVETGRVPEEKTRELRWLRFSEDGHELPRCRGDRTYRLPSLGRFEVEWTETEVHDLPEGFPIEIDEMRARKRYGSNSFFRVKEGWLFATDLWHYGGELGFVTDGGHRDPLGDDLMGTQFIIETAFGITVLAGKFDHAALAVLERDGGEWSYRQLFDLPSDAFGYAFAPDGTLLVRDDGGAVAITKELRIVPLECDSQP